MPSTDHDLFAMEEHLAALARVPDGSDWMVRANADSASALHDLVREARLEGRRGVIARYHAGPVAGHTAPAYQVLKSGYDFNDAVVAVSNMLIGKPQALVDDAARSKFGLLLRPVLAGSIQIDLVSPDPATKESGERPGEAPGQTTVEDLEGLKGTTDQALNIVLHVLQSSSVADRDAFADLTSGLSPRAWGKIAKLAARSVEAGFTVDFRSRTSPEWFSFSPANAAALRTFIRLRDLSTVEVDYEGIWQTASNVRSVFDLDLDDGTRITGTVPTDLRGKSIELVNQRVAVVIAETSADEDDTAIRRVLVSISPADE